MSFTERVVIVSRAAKEGAMKHVRRWGAVYVLAILFSGSWIGQFLSQLAEFRSDQQSHGEEFLWGDFWPAFWSSTFENWQSEWLQLVFQAVLLLGAKHWIFRVDAEDLERIEAKVDKVQASIAGMHAARDGRQSPS